MGHAITHVPPKPIRKWSVGPISAPPAPLDVQTVQSMEPMLNALSANQSQQPIFTSRERSVFRHVRTGNMGGPSASSLSVLLVTLPARSVKARGHRPV